MDSICMALGGRAAEELVFSKITTGAQNDLERITKIAYSMIAIYGMNKKVGNVSYYDPQNEYSFNKPYSEETAKIIDEEVKKLIDTAYQKSYNLLKEKRKELDKIAYELLEKEIIFKSDIERLIGKRPYDTVHAYEESSRPREDGDNAPLKNENVQTSDESEAVVNNGSSPGEDVSVKEEANDKISPDQQASSGQQQDPGEEEPIAQGNEGRNPIA